MNYVLVQAGPLAREWLQRQIRRPLRNDAMLWAAVTTTGRMGGVVALEDWTETGVGIHLALASPLVLRHAARFLGLLFKNREAVWALVVDGERSLRLARHLGFTVAGRVPRGYAPGADLVLIHLTREAWTARREKPRVR